LLEDGGSLRERTHAAEAVDLPAGRSLDGPHMAIVAVSENPGTFPGVATRPWPFTGHGDVASVGAHWSAGSDVPSCSRRNVTAEI
jgi:hypothetical protein